MSERSILKKITRPLWQILGFFVKENLERNADDLRKLRILLVINFICALLLTFYTFIGIKLGYDVMPLLFPMALLYINPFYLKRRDHYEASAKVVLFALCVSCWSLIYEFGGFKAITIFAMSLVTTCANSLLGTKKGAFWSILVVCVSLAIGLAHEVFDLPHYVYPWDRQVRLIALIVVVLPLVTHYMMAIYESSQREYEKKLASQNEELQRTLRSKQTLLAVMSHDMSNAIAIVNSSSQLAVDRVLKDEQKDKLWKKVHRASTMMHDIVLMVREMEAIDRGKAVLKMEDVDLLEVLEASKFVFEDAMKKKSLTLEFSANQIKPVVYAEKRSLLNNVFNNIISNAIKFSHQGGVIKVSLREDEKFVCLDIQDGGVGMDADQLSEIFLFSANTTREGTRGERGTGFGLPVVKVYMEAYGGKVEAHSREGGSLFSLFFLRGPKKT